MTRNSSSLLFFIISGVVFGYQTIRIAQPVVVEGSLLKDFASAPISELHLRIWNGIEWQTLPFQIDERDINGSFFDPDDLLFDDNDTLAFQPQNAGQQAALTQWIDDAEARQNPRIEVTITDPCENATGYTYLYRSSTLNSGGLAALVTYNEVDDTISGATYQVGFDLSGTILSDLRFRDGDQLTPDLLDREKLRISGSIIISSFDIDEDDLNLVSVHVIAGPVRVLRRVDAEITLQAFTIPLALERYFYRRYFEVPMASGSINLPLGVSLTAIRFSRDFNDQANGGGLRDPNNANLTVDGTPDAGVQTMISAAQQAAYWSEFALNDFSLWNAMSFSGLAASTSFYYHDNSGGATADGTPDTGDMVSFADNGVLFSSPEAGAIQFSFGTFIDQGGNLNPAAIEDYIAQPLITTPLSQNFAQSFWEFVALWGTNTLQAPKVNFLVDFINTFGVPVP